MNFIIKIQLFNLLGLSLMFLHSVSKTALYGSHPQYSKLSCSSYCLKTINGTYFPLDLRIYLLCNLWMQIFSRFTADKMVSKSYCQTQWLKITQESCKWRLTSYISKNYHFHFLWKGSVCHIKLFMLVTSHDIAHHHLQVNCNFVTH